jgi:hypothetical protein
MSIRKVLRELYRVAGIASARGAWLTDCDVASSDRVLADFDSRSIAYVAARWGDKVRIISAAPGLRLMSAAPDTLFSRPLHAGHHAAGGVVATAQSPCLTDRVNELLLKGDPDELLAAARADRAALRYPKPYQPGTPTYWTMEKGKRGKDGKDDDDEAGVKSLTDAEIDNMTADEARASLKQYMKRARAKQQDDDKDDDED